MKKYVIALIVSVFVAISGAVNAQLVKQKTKVEEKNQVDRDWYNCSFEKDGVYGACVNEAYEFLKGKKVKTRPIVALIGTGIDTEHEALKANIWKNKKEKEDGKDNDKNGYVDDMNGWNFIGGKDGQVMPFVMREGEREFLRFKDKYGDVVSDGDIYYSFATGKKEIFTPENAEEFNYYRKYVWKESRLAQAMSTKWMDHVSADYTRLFDKEVRAKYPDKEKITVADVLEVCAPSKDDTSIRGMILYGIQIVANTRRTDDWESIYKIFVAESRFTDGQQKYDRTYAKYGNDGRQVIVGDNYLDINDRVYGNNVLLTADAAIGTMIAGVIVGQRGVEGRNNPIADQAEIMTLVVQAGEGEPYLKDMALAIRYAVDHGADVIMLPVQNSLYPENQKKWVSEALEYAEGKGVFCVVPAWEASQDLSVDVYYPNRWITGKKELTNLMVVSSSDKNGNPSMNSNYGAKEVDLYAPGMEIYSAYTGDTYQTGTGLGLAAATTTGVAALIKAYYPHLMGTQIRNILLETVTSRKDVEVEKGILVNGKSSQDLFLFGDLCLSGGIINAYQAVVAADKMAK